MSKPVLAVVGGGVAGLAAAEALAQSGARVVLLEQRRRPGGRAGDLEDPVTGWRIENGQHVWMPGCTELIDFFERTGLAPLTVMQPRLRLGYLEKGRAPALLLEGSGPGALGLLGPLLRHALLGGRDRLALLRGLLSLKWGGRKLEREGSERAFGEWLSARGQTERAVAVFWDPFLGAILNEPAALGRADLAAFAVRLALLEGGGRARLGWSREPLGRLWEQAGRHLQERGVELRMGQRVLGVEIESDGPPAAGGTGGRVRRLRLEGGRTLEVEAVVLAVPPPAFPGLLGAERAGDPFFAPPARLEWSPILNIHLWYPEPVISEEVTCVVGSPLHWIFIKPAQQPRGGSRPVPPGAQYLNLVVSYSRSFLGRPSGAIAAEMAAELEALLPGVRGQRPLAARVVHERRATFRSIPGSESARPGPATPVKGLVLAGSWTATGWPATLEGAVRSGRAAARSLLVNRT